MNRKLLGVFVLGAASYASLCGCGGDMDFRLPDPAVRYVAFGDSATRGPSERDYVEFLQDLLGEAPAAFSNEGKGGETSDEGVGRLRSLISRQIFPNAEVLFLWEGGNDTTDFIKDRDPLLFFSPDSSVYPYSAQLTEKLDKIQANIEEAIRIGTEAGLEVFVATYYFLPEGSLNCDPLLLDILLPAQAVNANVYVTKLNERLRLAAANQGAILVDVASEDAVLRADPENYFNCNHLSAQGNEIVARLFFDVLTHHTSGG
ncbi:MAG: SGNH/GDSL hydrolase family protein [Phycisphaerae bacterium]|nr:SGNH/GDSL hydrolase family protein [Phycisphaerae bacterium]